MEGMEGAGMEGMAGVTAGVRYNRTIQNGRRQTEEEADNWEAKLANDKQSRRKLTKGRRKPTEGRRKPRLGMGLRNKSLALPKISTGRFENKREELPK